MNEIFVDTSGWASLADVSEPFYQKSPGNLPCRNAESPTVRDNELCFSRTRRFDDKPDAFSSPANRRIYQRHQTIYVFRHHSY